MIRFWPKFKVSFLGPSSTDVNCHSGICPGNIWPDNICPYWQHLSFYCCTNFDQPLEVGFLDHIYQMPCVRVHLSRQHFSWWYMSAGILTFVQATFDLTTFVHISKSAIYQLLLDQFWPTFKGWFLRTSLTDTLCQGNIGPANICPDDIFPWKQYQNCYWPNYT